MNAIERLKVQLNELPENECTYVLLTKIKVGMVLGLSFFTINTKYHGVVKLPKVVVERLGLPIILDIEQHEKEWRGNASMP